MSKIKKSKVFSKIRFKIPMMTIFVVLIIISTFTNDYAVFKTAKKNTAIAEKLKHIDTALDFDNIIVLFCGEDENTDIQNEKNIRILYRKTGNYSNNIFAVSPNNTFREETELYIAIFGIYLAGTILVIIMSEKMYKKEKSNQKLREEIKEMIYLAHVYQKVISSTDISWKEIFYIDLKKGKCRMIFPELDNENKLGDYQTGVQKYILSGKIEGENTNAIEEFLDLGNIKKALKDKNSIELEYKRLSENGKYERCLASIEVVEKENDEPVSVSLSIRSIESMLKKVQDGKELITISAKRAEAANRAKSDFLSRMSDDIRTPLNAILGMTSVAAMYIDEKERVMDSLNKINVSGEHLLGIINEVLEMSKLESGKFNLTESEFCISDIIDNLINLFRSQLDAKNLNLKVNVRNVDNENVIGDAQRLQQVFVKIMENAVKFTPSGGIITLTISEKKSRISGSGYYEFIFEDTGIGMEKEFIKEIFEPFAREDSSRIGMIEGNGLGMSIAVNLARMMGGDILVESEVGKGSKFTVEMYLRLNDIREEDLRDFVDLSVLVVDDEEYVCESVCEALNSMSMRAEYVLNCDSAMKRLTTAREENDDFSVVILDWKMLINNESEIIEEIREVIGKDIPIIILADYDCSGVDKETQLKSINAFIKKPLFKSRLIHTIKKVIEIGKSEKRGYN